MRWCRTSDPRTHAILAFATAILNHLGSVDDRDIQPALDAGLEQGTLIDVVAVENTLGNYVNNLAQTPLDPILQRAAARYVVL